MVCAEQECPGFELTTEDVGKESIGFFLKAPYADNLSE